MNYLNGLRPRMHDSQSYGLLLLQFTDVSEPSPRASLVGLLRTYQEDAVHQPDQICGAHEHNNSSSCDRMVRHPSRRPATAEASRCQASPCHPRGWRQAWPSGIRDCRRFRQQHSCRCQRTRCYRDLSQWNLGPRKVGELTPNRAGKTRLLARQPLAMMGKGHRK